METSLERRLGIYEFAVDRGTIPLYSPAEILYYPAGVLFMRISKSTLLHLRFPFSYFLMPVYMLAVAIARDIDPWNAIWMFVILHLLVFPASHGFNSFYDRDEGSIGGLARPPKVTNELLSVSLVLDALALALSFLVHPYFAIGVFLYGLSSKAYSWKKTRVKRFPVAGWLFTSFGQGSVVFALVTLCAGDPDLRSLLLPDTLIPVLLAGIFILGCYPLTQVYQHDEDARRGDRTMSVVLGTRGTFMLSSPLLIAAMTGFFLYFLFFCSPVIAFVFLVSQAPSAVYLAFWTIGTFRDERKASFRFTMGMNFVAATCINVFSVILFVVKGSLCR